MKKGGIVFVWVVRALKTELPVGQVWPWQERKGLIFHWSAVSLVCGCRECEQDKRFQ